MNTSSVETATRFPVEFLPSPSLAQDARTPKFSGRHLYTGEFELCPSSVKIWQEHDGWTHYLAYGLGPLGYFLAPVLGSLTSYVDECEIPNKAIINFRIDFSAKEIEVLGNNDRGILWQWKFYCQYIGEIVKHIGDSIKVEHVEPVHAHSEESADQPRSHLEAPTKTLATTIGIETSRGALTPLIQRGVSLPFTHKEAFSTAHDNQEIIDMNIYQGECRYVAQARKIGTFRICGVRPARRGEPSIEVDFTVHANGSFSVHARDTTTSSELKVI